MPDSPIVTHPLLRLGRLTLGPGLRGLAPGSAESGLVATATVAVPESPVSRSAGWDVAWADAVREASRLGADPATAQALERGAGTVSGGGGQVVVAAHGEAVLTWRLPPGAGVSSVRVGPLPHLQAVADAAARDATKGSSYRIGRSPTEFLVDDFDTGVEVPLEDGLVWAAVHQDAIVVQLPDRAGPLAGEPAAVLLRRGSAG